MKAKPIATTLVADAGTSELSPPAPECFLSTMELLKRLPVSRGTLDNWRKAGLIPFVKLPGRRIVWHWPSVEAALLRLQRG